MESGHRPRDLTEAINRRSQHLAHSAITAGDQWVTDAARTSHTAHPSEDNVHRLQRIVIDIAAYRERSGHIGDDPLGPEPDTTNPLHPRWKQLHHQPHVDLDAGSAPLTL